jgi:conjugal transfer pilus assembly protein TraK
MRRPLPSSIPLAAMVLAAGLSPALAAAQPSPTPSAPAAVAAPAPQAAPGAQRATTASLPVPPGPQPRAAGSPLAGAAPAVQPPPAAVPLPSVPASAVGRPPAPGAPAQAVQANVVERTGGAVYVALRQNNIFPVAQGHINRIVTPFGRAGVRTASTEQIITEGNIVYVTPVGEAPVTMFITEAGDERTAISVTLVPRGIPPVELDLRIPGFTPVHARATPAAVAQERSHRAERHDQAERWERSQPYVEAVTSLARRIAMGEIPPGYEAASGAGLPVPVCTPAVSGVTVTFRGGQAFVGAHLAAFVGVAHNTTRESVEFVESWCGGSRGVAAVALAPSPTLAPGARAEVIVVVRSAPSESRAGARPSLLGVSAPGAGAR